MNGLVWVLLVGIAGWLTGKIIGGRGYGESLAGNATDWLDVVIGVVGGSITGFLFPGAINVGGSSFSGYVTPIIGSITLVWAARLISAKYISSNAR